MPPDITAKVNIENVYQNGIEVDDAALILTNQSYEDFVQVDLTIGDRLLRFSVSSTDLKRALLAVSQ